MNETTLPRCLREVRIPNERGLHARPATLFVELAMTFGSTITVRKGAERVSGSSILSLLLLAAGTGTELVLEAEGHDAEAACAALAALVESGFGEELAEGIP